MHLLSFCITVHLLCEQACASAAVLFRVRHFLRLRPPLARCTGVFTDTLYSTYRVFRKGPLEVKFHVLSTVNSIALTMRS